MIDTIQNNYKFYLGWAEHTVCTTVRHIFSMVFRDRKILLKYLVIETPYGKIVLMLLK